MMTSIQQNETDAYAELWSSVSAYKRVSPGEQYAETFHRIVQDPGATVLDAGCGEGRGLLALASLGYQVAGLDLTDAGLSPDAKQHPFVVDTLWHDLKPAAYLLHLQRPEVFRPDGVDYIFSCDVFEHLPTQFTMLAVQRLLDIATRGLFCSVFYAQEGYGPWIGRPLHLTVQPFTWWRDSLREMGELMEARDCQDFGLFYLRAR